MQGCEINWKKGKNVTVKTIKKKQKHKSRGSVRTVTKSVQADSFFNFFSPPAMPEDPNSTLASDIQVKAVVSFLTKGQWYFQWLQSSRSFYQATWITLKIYWLKYIDKPRNLKIKINWA